MYTGYVDDCVCVSSLCVRHSRRKLVELPKTFCAYNPELIALPEDGAILLWFIVCYYMSDRVK